MSEALQMADELDGLCSQYDSEIAAELRRLHSELERKSDAIQRLWKERDELRTLNAELVEALQGLADEFVRVFPVYYYAEPWAHDKNLSLRVARAALAKVGGSK